MIVKCIERPYDVQCQLANLSYYRITDDSIYPPFRKKLEEEIKSYKAVGHEILVEWTE